MNLFRKFFTVSSGTFLSRIFGFIREMLMATALGTGPVADAFNAAFRFPNTFRRLFAEGAFSSAFIPLFAKEVENNGMEGAKKLSSEVFGVLFTILLLLTIIMQLTMPILVTYIIAPGFIEDPEKFNLTNRLALIMFPYLACMSLASMMAGMLNGLRKYFAAAIAPVFLNIILISILAVAWYKDFTVFDIGIALAWGVFASGVIQLAIVFFAVRRAGVKISLQRPTISPNVKKLLWLALPAAITGGITQINLLVSTNIASSQSGAVSSLVYADRLYQLPLGMVGIAVATVLLPELSRSLREKCSQKSFALQNRSLEFTLLLTLPASFGFLLLSYPIVQLIYERGEFTSASTIIVSNILTIYGLGLPAFVLIKTFIPSFFAREDTKTPMIFAAISMLTNLILCLTLFPLYSVEGIAVAEVTAGWVNAILLFTTLLIRKDWKADKQLIKNFISILFSCLLMSLVVYLALNYLVSGFNNEQSGWYRLYSLSLLIGLAVITYFTFIITFSGISIRKIKGYLQK